MTQLMRSMGIRGLVLIWGGKLGGELLRGWVKTQPVHQIYNRLDYSSLLGAELLGNLGASLGSRRLMAGAVGGNSEACGGFELEGDEG